MNVPRQRRYPMRPMRPLITARIHLNTGPTADQLKAIVDLYAAETRFHEAVKALEKSQADLARLRGERRRT